MHHLIVVDVIERMEDLADDIGGFQLRQGIPLSISVLQQL